MGFLSDILGKIQGTNKETTSNATSASVAASSDGSSSVGREVGGFSRQSAKPSIGSIPSVGSATVSGGTTAPTTSSTYSPEPEGIDVVDVPTVQQVSQQSPEQDLIPRSRSKAEIDAAPKPVSFSYAQPTYTDAAPRQLAAQSNSGDGGGKRRGKKKGKSSVKSQTYAQSVDAARKAISSANALQGESVEFEPVVAPEYGTSDDIGERRAQLAETTDMAARNARDFVARRKAAALDATAKRQAAVVAAGQQLRKDLARRRSDITRYARDRNDGADMLTARDLSAIGVTPDELEALGMSDMIPASVRYDGVPGPESIMPGDVAYQAHVRLDEASGDALDRLIEMRDQEVADQISVFRDDEVDPEDLASFQDLANGVAPEEIGSVNDRARRLRDSRVLTQMAWLNPLRLFKGLIVADTFTDQGFDYVMANMSPEAMNAISSVSIKYGGLSIDNCLRLVMARGGISYDNFSQMKPDLRDAVVLELCNDIIESQRKNGLPNNMVTGMPWSRGVRDERGNVVFGGTRCFPFGYIPNSVMSEIIRLAPSDSPLRGKTMEQVRKMEWEEFINNTYPAAYENMEAPQLSAYRNGMTALLELDGQNPNYFDIPIDTEMTYMMILEDSKLVNDPVIARSSLVSAEEVVKGKNRAEAKYRHSPKARLAHKEGTPSSGHESSIVMTAYTGDNVIRSVTNMMIANSATRSMTMVSAIPEGGLAAIESRFVGWIDHVLTKASLKNVSMADYTASAYAISHMRSRQGKEALDVANALYHLDGLGWDVFGLYDSKGYKFTKADFGRFVKDLRGMNDGKIADFDAFMSNAMHFWSKMQLGDGLFLANDAEQWVSMSLRMMAEYADRGVTKGVITSKQADDAISAGGVEQFVREMMMNSEAARDAFMFSGLNTFNSKNPYSHIVERMFNAHGITKFAFALLIDKYPVYGINKPMQAIPSNTVSYIVSTIGAAYGDASGIDTMSRIRNYQAGMRSADWFDGFRRNLIYDVVHYGNKWILKNVIYHVIGALGGLGLPDDEDKYAVMEEYRIGGANGVPIKYAWWLDDIMGISAPLAYTSYLKENGAYDRDGNLHEVDQEMCTDILWNGIISQMSGIAILDAFETVRNLNSEMQMLKLMQTNPEAYAALASNDKTMPENGSQLFSAYLEHYLIANTLRSLTPEIFQEMFPLNKGFLLRDPESLAHTAWSEWDTSSDQTKQEAMDAYDTRSVSYREGMRRKDAQNNLLYALALNLWNGIFSDPSKTGYFYDQQAISSKPDEYALAKFKEHDFDPWKDLVDEDGNALTGDARQLALNERAAALISDLTDNYDNPYEAAANGFVLSGNARWNAKNYCYYMYLTSRDHFYELKNDESWTYRSKEERNAIYDQLVTQPYKYWVEGIYYKWLNPDIIPSAVPKYLRQETDYQTYYVDEEGNPANYFDWLMGNASEKTYGFGNAPSDFSLWTTPRQKNKGYNYETPAYFYIPGMTDTGTIAEDMRDMYVEGGMDDGENMEQLYFGGQPDGSLSIPEDSSEAPTISHREYLDIDVSRLPSALQEMSKASFKEAFGVDCLIPMEGDDKVSPNRSSDMATTNTQGSGSGGGNYWYSGYSRSSGGSGGSYSYSGGGGGSSYTPKVYSSSRQVYSSRPSGMSSRQPYKPSTTYLRPGFYTTGSRKSVSRQN
jgi:hypothetical protein